MQSFNNLLEMKRLIFILLQLVFIGEISAQELIVIESKNLKCNDSILVFTPKQFKKAKEPIPTLFLLHGWSGCYKNWSDKANLQEISNRWGFRIITPDGFYNSWYLNNSDSTKMQWRAFFNSELYPEMERRYNLDSSKTFITGLSMGGHGAINLFIDNPNRFAAAGSMSGVLNLQDTNLKEKQLSKVVGTYSVENPRYYTESAINRVAKLKGIDKVLVVTCGYDDFYKKCTIDFAAKCKSLKIPHIEILSPGNHSWTYWDFALEQHLFIFDRVLKGKNLGY